MFESEALRVKY